MDDRSDFVGDRVTCPKCSHAFEVDARTRSPITALHTAQELLRRIHNALDQELGDSDMEPGLDPLQDLATEIAAALEGPNE